jgi:SAM-dependent methyltransferase
VPPYAALAVRYDRLVGDDIFPIIQRSFERCVAELGLSFRGAADIGCGTGRFLEYLLRYQVPLIGIDASPAMLRVALRRLPRDRVQLLRQDIRRLRLGEPVDIITCNGDTLNYLTRDRDLADALHACRRNLLPGGHLVGDLLTGRPTARVPALDVALPGHLSHWRGKADPERRLTVVDFRCADSRLRGGGWAHERHLQKWHAIPELRTQLRRAGLRLRALWPLDAPSEKHRGGWVKFAAQNEARG